MLCFHGGAAAAVGPGRPAGPGTDYSALWSRASCSSTLLRLHLCSGHPQVSELLSVLRCRLQRLAVTLLTDKTCLCSAELQQQVVVLNTARYPATGIRAGKWNNVTF